MIFLLLERDKHHVIVPHRKMFVWIQDAETLADAVTNERAAF